MHDLRAEFPVLERLAYLNTGSNGPVPRRAVEAAAESMRLQLAEGRGDRVHFEATAERIDSLRGRVAGLLGCETAELALTGSTTDGVNAVLAALDLGRGDDVLTSDEEHPGVLAPLAALRERRGVSVRMVPVAELGGEVRPQTRLVACSHVSWITGAVADTAAWPPAPRSFCSTARRVLAPCLPRSPSWAATSTPHRARNGCAGPNGLGYLYVRGELAAELPSPWPSYGVLVDSAKAFELELHPDARRFSTGFPAPHQIEWALAALDVLEEAGVEARACARGRPGGRARAGAWRPGGAARAHHARVLGGSRPRGGGRTAALGGPGRSQSPGRAPRARVGGSMVDRGRVGAAGLALATR